MACGLTSGPHLCCPKLCYLES